MQRPWVIGGLIVLVLVVGFVLLVPHTRDISKPAGATVSTVVPPVFVHDSYKKGTHNLSVSVAAPNACTSVTATASSASTSPAISIAISMPLDTGICLQAISTTTIPLTVSAPQGASITASVNGQNATVVQQ